MYCYITDIRPHIENPSRLNICWHIFKMASGYPMPHCLLKQFPRLTDVFIKYRGHKIIETNTHYPTLYHPTSDSFLPSLAWQWFHNHVRQNSSSSSTSI